MTDKLSLKSKRFAIWMIVALVVVIADQVTKSAIIQYMPYPSPPRDINSFLTLTHQQNEGAAWSFLADAGGWQRYFFIVLATAVSAVIGVWLWRIRHEGPLILAAGLSLVLGGAVGNVVDRIRLGHVTDFIQVWFGSWPFPSFNVADAAITVGAALLIVDSLFGSGRDGAAAEK